MGIAMGKKKEKKEREPQYRQSLTNMQVRNYRVYEMSPIERILVFLAAFAAGAFCGYLFYGGLAKDPYGNATLLTYMLNLTIPSVVGIAAGFFFLPIWEKRQQESRQSNLNKQFLDLLESLSTSLLAGKNVNQSFRDAKRDLSIQYSAESDIQKELAVILDGLDTNISVESLLLDFGKRSGVDDIESFANVFDTCYRKGGNIKEVIRNTSMILEEKSRIQREIETKLAANKNEQLI